MALLLRCLGVLSAAGLSLSTHPCLDRRSADVVPDPGDCHSYYHCLTNGRPLHRRCPQGLAFDPKLKVCTKDYDAHACVPDRRDQPRTGQHGDSRKEEDKDHFNIKKRILQYEPAPERNIKANLNPRPNPNTKTKRVPQSILTNYEDKSETGSEKSTGILTTPKRVLANSNTTTLTKRLMLAEKTSEEKGISMKNLESELSLLAKIISEEVKKRRKQRQGAEREDAGDQVAKGGDLWATPRDARGRETDRDGHHNDRTGLGTDHTLSPSAAEKAPHSVRKRSPEDDDNVLADIRCPTSYAYLVDASNCSVFFHCFNWKPSRKVCPSGLFFDDQRFVCNWPHSVNCIQGSRAKSAFSFYEMRRKSLAGQMAPAMVAFKSKKLPPPVIPSASRRTSSPVTTVTTNTTAASTSAIASTTTTATATTTTATTTTTTTTTATTAPAATTTLSASTTIYRDLTPTKPTKSTSAVRNPSSTTSDAMPFPRRSHFTKYNYSNMPKITRHEYTGTTARVLEMNTFIRKEKSAEGRLTAKSIPTSTTFHGRNQETLTPSFISTEMYRFPKWLQQQQRIHSDFIEIKNRKPQQKRRQKPHSFIFRPSLRLQFPNKRPNYRLTDKFSFFEISKLLKDPLYSKEKATKNPQARLYNPLKNHVQQFVRQTPTSAPTPSSVEPHQFTNDIQSLVHDRQKSQIVATALTGDSLLVTAGRLETPAETDTSQLKMKSILDRTTLPAESGYGPGINSTVINSYDRQLENMTTQSVITQSTSAVSNQPVEHEGSTSSNSTLLHSPDVETSPELPKGASTFYVTYTPSKYFTQPSGEPVSGTAQTAVHSTKHSFNGKGISFRASRNHQGHLGQWLNRDGNLVSRSHPPYGYRSRWHNRNNRHLTAMPFYTMGTKLPTGTYNSAQPFRGPPLYGRFRNRRRRLYNHVGDRGKTDRPVGDVFTRVHGNPVHAGDFSLPPHVQIETYMAKFLKDAAKIRTQESRGSPPDAAGVMKKQVPKATESISYKTVRVVTQHVPRVTESSSSNPVKVEEPQPFKVTESSSSNPEKEEVPQVFKATDSNSSNPARIEEPHVSKATESSWSTDHLSGSGRRNGARAIRVLDVMNTSTAAGQMRLTKETDIDTSESQSNGFTDIGITDADNTDDLEYTVWTRAHDESADSQISYVEAAYTDNLTSDNQNETLQAHIVRDTIEEEITYSGDEETGETVSRFESLSETVEVPNATQEDPKHVSIPRVTQTSAVTLMPVDDVFVKQLEDENLRLNTGNVIIVDEGKVSKSKVFQEGTVKGIISSSQKHSVLVDTFPFQGDESVTVGIDSDFETTLNKANFNSMYIENNTTAVQTIPEKVKQQETKDATNHYFKSLQVSVSRLADSPIKPIETNGSANAIDSGVKGVNEKKQPTPAAYLSTGSASKDVLPEHKNDRSGDFLTYSNKEPSIPDSNLRMENSALLSENNTTDLQQSINHTTNDRSAGVETISDKTVSMSNENLHEISQQINDDFDEISTPKSITVENETHELLFSAQQSSDANQDALSKRISANMSNQTSSRGNYISDTSVGVQQSETIVSDETNEPQGLKFTDNRHILDSLQSSKGDSNEPPESPDGKNVIGNQGQNSQGSRDESEDLSLVANSVSRDRVGSSEENKYVRKQRRLSPHSKQDLSTDVTRSIQIKEIAKHEKDKPRHNKYAREGKEPSPDGRKTSTDKRKGGSKKSFVSLTDLITWYLKHWRNYSQWQREQTPEHAPGTAAV